MKTMLPTHKEFIDEVARAIGRDRLYRDATELLENTLGIVLSNSDSLDARFDREFDKLWKSDDDESIWNRDNYRADAIVAINKINLLLLTLQV